MSDRLLSAGEVIELTGIGRSTLYKWIKADKFPKGIKINGLRKWWMSTVLGFVNNIVDSERTQLTSLALKPKRMRLAKHVKQRDHSK